MPARRKTAKCKPKKSAKTAPLLQASEDGGCIVSDEG